jgi:hypothetical protein
MSEAKVLDAKTLGSKPVVVKTDVVKTVDVNTADMTALLRSVAAEGMPLSGGGQTPLRHARLMDLGRQNLPLARLAEAHFDAVAILAEARRQPEKGALYGVWASEIPGEELSLSGGAINGVKRFCSGAGIVDRALITVGGPEPLLVDLDLRENPGIHFDESDWKTNALIETHTATATFAGMPVAADEVIGPPGWYLDRLGFWRGAIGPAGCWAGGAEGLVDYAAHQKRNDPHTMAHFGAMHSSVWALRSYLESAGREIDKDTNTFARARILALTVRHLVEQSCTDILRRLTRAYGPHPLVSNSEVSRRYLDLDLYLRQSHAERDLETLGRVLRES